MSKYKIIAKNKQGKTVEKEIEASNEREVAENLRKDGFWLTSIEKKGEKKKTASFFDRENLVSVPLKHKMIFCRHLAVMIASGLALSKALLILSVQEKNKSFKSIIKKVSLDVGKGTSFADGMEKYPKVFDSVFVSMVRMGELSGNLEKVLNILADQMEKDHKLISKVRGALIYPAVIIVVMICIGILMMIFVVPKITGVFADFGSELPLATRIVLKISTAMAAHPFLIFGGIFGGIFFLRTFAKRKAGKKIFHKLYLKAPVIGNIIQKVNSARFSRILSALLNSGTSLVESLEITADTLKNYYFKKSIKKASKEVQKGIDLSAVFKQDKGVFPYLIIQMLEVGEETGKTPEILEKLAMFYEEEVDQITKNLSSVIEPILMVLIGTAVGIFAIAIIQPIYSVMERI